MKNSFEQIKNNNKKEPKKFKNKKQFISHMGLRRQNTEKKTNQYEKCGVSEMERIRRQYRQINKKNLGSRIATKQHITYIATYVYMSKNIKVGKKNEKENLVFCTYV